MELFDFWSIDGSCCGRTRWGAVGCLDVSSHHLDVVLATEMAMLMCAFRQFL